MNAAKLPLFGIAVLGLLLSVASCRVAEEDTYGRWDADADARLDRNEFTTAWGEAAYFSRWDANRDGTVDESEWNAGRNTYLSRYDETQHGAFTDWNTSGSGSMSEDELRVGIFTYYDTDGDNYLSQDEYRAWRGTSGGGSATGSGTGSN
ncbi:EF-hand domain-containing protein [Cesiribacter andamanensis]|uniref:EF hand containing protein n=1 Tax=Cesiribacter andamanensis AMV16 TaxID=1279009 RepID=M7N046_9BACT|nr:EF-hand domain-containing protein [Cesiribacter andamanensis]EMR02063.1 EF hand containing protein [Cesiribacter andamanensis AMV16]